MRTGSSSSPVCEAIDEQTDTQQPDKEEKKTHSRMIDIEPELSIDERQIADEKHIIFH